MQISRKSDYALRAMMHVATYGTRIPVSINEIAGRQKLPRDFTAKILKELTHAGLLRSTKGVNGGYMLAKDSTTITFLDIIQAVDGPVYLNRCVHPTVPCECENMPDCPMHNYWVKEQVRVVDSLSGMNLSDVAVDPSKRAEGK